MPYPRRRRPRPRTYALARPRRRLPRARGFFRRHKPRSIPILPVAGVAYTTLFKPHPWGSDMPIDKLKNGNFQGFFQDLITQAVSITPDGKKFDWNIGFQFYLPIVGGAIGHMVMNKLGVNKYMARIPMIGKYLSL